MRFTVLVDFYSEQFKSQYCKGLQYTIRQGNQALYNACIEWEKEGKIAFLSGMAVSEIQGSE